MVVQVLHETTEENRGITREDPTMNPDDMLVTVEGGDSVEVEVLPDSSVTVEDEDAGSGSDRDTDYENGSDEEDDDDSEDEEEVEELQANEEYC